MVMVVAAALAPLAGVFDPLLHEERSAEAIAPAVRQENRDKRRINYTSFRVPMISNSLWRRFPPPDQMAFGPFQQGGQHHPKQSDDHDRHEHARGLERVGAF